MPEEFENVPAEQKQGWGQVSYGFKQESSSLVASKGEGWRGDC